MKFQVEFSEVTKNLSSFDMEKALFLVDKICAGEMRRKTAVKELMEIHYHGGPMWGGKECFNALYGNSCALVSFSRPEQLAKVIEIAKAVTLDNGAYPNWKNAKRKNLIVDWDLYWESYYEWVEAYINSIKWFIAPDVIEGTEEENDELLSKLPEHLKHKAVPVWHSVESIDRLVRLCEEWPRVAIGLCGPHETTMSKPAQDRLEEAFKAIYVDRKLKVKIHGLRMLDGRVLGKFPLESADSTNVSINVPKWYSKYPKIGLHILERSESFRIMVRHEGLELAVKYLKLIYKEVESEIDKGELLLHRTAILKGSVESVLPPTVKSWVRAKNNINNLEVVNG